VMEDSGGSWDYLVALNQVKCIDELLKTAKSFIQCIELLEEVVTVPLYMTLECDKMTQLPLMHLP